MLIAKITIVARCYRATFVFFHVRSRQDPRSSHRRQTLYHIPGELGIAPRAAAIVNADGIVDLGLSVEGFGRPQRNFSHRNSDVGIDLARRVDARRIWQLVAAVRLDGIFSSYHKCFCPDRPMKNLEGKGQHPFASIIWIRFDGSFAFPHKTLSLRPALAGLDGSPVTG